MEIRRQDAFTLIELLIVVTIIAIIGIASISWFSRMVEVQDAETAVKGISDTLESFDRAVMRHEAASYETVFESGSSGFTTDLDWYKKTAPVRYSFEFSTGTGIVKSTSTGTGEWELHFSPYDSAWTSSALPASGGTQSFSFPSNIQKRWFKISSGMGNDTLNSYIIQYYNLTNVTGIPENEIRLMSIVGTSAWTDKQYDFLKVRNILGKKVLQGSGTTLDPLDKATLFLEKNGKEMTVTVSP